MNNQKPLITYWYIPQFSRESDLSWVDCTSERCLSLERANRVIDEYILTNYANQSSVEYRIKMIQNIETVLVYK